MERFSVDTNILVYSLDRDAVDKHQLAIQLLDALVDHDCVLSLQALGEFFHVVTRKGHVSPGDARALIQDWMTLFPVVSADGRQLDKAMAWKQKGLFSFWDGLLFATVSAAGVSRLFTEDMQHGFELSNTKVINPFDPAYDYDIRAILA